MIDAQGKPVYSICEAHPIAQQNPTMLRDLHKWLRRSTVASSEAVQVAAIRAWERFAETAKIDPLIGVDQETMAFFAVYLLEHEKIYRAGTIKSYLYAMQRTLNARGVRIDIAQSWTVGELQKAAKRWRASNKPSLQPIVTTTLGDMLRQLDTTNPKARTIGVVWQVAHATAARLGELVPTKTSDHRLKRRHVRLLAPGHLAIGLDHSKTDYECRGVQLHVFGDGPTHDAAGKLLNGFERKVEGKSIGPSAFNALNCLLGGKYDSNGYPAELKDRDLFSWEPSRSLMRADVTLEAQRALKAAGYDAEEYGGHSWRKGTAQSLFNKGMDMRDISCFGRWAKGSSCVRLYRQISTTVRRDWAKLLTTDTPLGPQSQQRVELDELEQLALAEAALRVKEPKHPATKPPAIVKRKRSKPASRGNDEAEAAPGRKKTRTDEYARTYSTIASARKEKDRSNRNNNDARKRAQALRARGSTPPLKRGERISQRRI